MCFDNVVRGEKGDLILGSLASKARRSGLDDRRVSDRAVRRKTRGLPLEAHHGRRDRLLARAVPTTPWECERGILGAVCRIAGLISMSQHTVYRAGGRKRTEQPVCALQTRPFAFIILDYNRPCERSSGQYGVGRTGCRRRKRVDKHVRLNTEDWTDERCADVASGQVRVGEEESVVLRSPRGSARFSVDQKSLRSSTARTR